MWWVGEKGIDVVNEFDTLGAAYVVICNQKWDYMCEMVFTDEWALSMRRMWLMEGDPERTGGAVCRFSTSLPLASIVRLTPKPSLALLLGIATKIGSKIEVRLWMFCCQYLVRNLEISLIIWQWIEQGLPRSNFYKIIYTSQNIFEWSSVYWWFI